MARNTRTGRENIVMRLRNMPRRSWLGTVQPGRARVRGFTLIELMIVMTIIAILAGMAAVHYEGSVTRAKEAALHHDLSVMRDSIEQYTLDKEQAPQSLDDLVSSGYLRAVPVDPMTGAKDWVVATSDLLLSPDETSNGGITDVHSASDRVSSFEGTPYSSW